MAKTTSSTTKKESSFIAKIAKLDGEYRVLLTRREALDVLINAKEEEINQFLYNSAHPKK